MFQRDTVETGYNDIGLHDTWSIASDIVAPTDKFTDFLNEPV